MRTLLLLAQPDWREDNLNDPLSSPLLVPVREVNSSAMLPPLGKLSLFLQSLGLLGVHSALSDIRSCSMRPVKLKLDGSCFRAVGQTGLAGLREARRCSEYLRDVNNFTHSTNIGRSIIDGRYW